MAKKRETTSVPTVTNLPLPISETPLVIDLPDGQKLVIGKMANGSIIEVATWRGTGRPDSRTNRLMLGMSSANSLAASTETIQPSTTPRRNVGLKGVKLPKIDLTSLISRVKSIFEKAAKPVARVSNVEPEEFTSDFNVDEWLAKITSKAERANELPKKSPKKVAVSKSSKPAKKK